jgi:hypothetical protein
VAGFTYAQYESDSGGGGNFGRAMDDFYLGQTGGVGPVQLMGAVATSGLVGMPQGLTPRHVVGRTSGGLQGRAVCYTLTAPLWDGTETEWQGKSKAGVTETYTVTGYVGEKRTVRNNP